MGEAKEWIKIRETRARRRGGWRGWNGGGLQTRKPATRLLWKWLGGARVCTRMILGRKRMNFDIFVEVGGRLRGGIHHASGKAGRTTPLRGKYPNYTWSAIFLVDLDAFLRCDIDPAYNQIVICLIFFFFFFIKAWSLYTGLSGYEEINQCRLLVVRSNLRCVSFRR